MDGNKRGVFCFRSTPLQRRRRPKQLHTTHTMDSIYGFTFDYKKNWIRNITFTLIYAFAFNAFNLLYFSAELPLAALLINVTSAILNAVAFIYLFKRFIQNSSA